MSIKLAIVTQNRPGMSHAELRHHLQYVHAPMCLAEDEVGGRFLSYVHHYVNTSLPTPADYGSFVDCGAFTTINFADMDAVVASKQSDAYVQRIGPDEDNFRNEEGSFGFFVAQSEVHAPAGEQAIMAIILRKITGDLAEFASRWIEAVQQAITQGELPQPASYVSHAALDGKGAHGFNHFDEIGFANSENLFDFLAALEVLARQEGAAGPHHLMLCDTVIFK